MLWKPPCWHKKHLLNIPLGKGLWRHWTGVLQAHHRWEEAGGTIQSLCCWGGWRTLTNTSGCGKLNHFFQCVCVWYMLLSWLWHPVSLWMSDVHNALSSTAWLSSCGPVHMASKEPLTVLQQGYSSVGLATENFTLFLKVNFQKASTRQRQQVHANNAGQTPDTCKEGKITRTSPDTAPVYGYVIPGQFSQRRQFQRKYGTPSTILFPQITSHPQIANQRK